jgi:oligopeptide/dipeptide ABC transporter ATP-binding protein
MADEVMVMYAGRVVESSGRRALYYEPHHPYTKGLLESIPSSAATAEGERLKPIKGSPPSLINLPSGCSFHPRCPYVMDVCLTDVPPLYPVGGEVLHRSACHLPADEVGLGAAVEAARVATAEAHRDEETVAQSEGARKPRKRTAASGAAGTTPARRSTRTKS